MTSYAKTTSEQPITAANAQRDFDAVRTGELPITQEATPSKMVAKDRPYPAPRPSNDIAADMDRIAFNKRWDEEARLARDARKQAFLQERKPAKAKGRQKQNNRGFDR